jgi:type IX secretion system PorP/SprF family membrane protein
MSEKFRKINYSVSQRFAERMWGYKISDKTGFETIFLPLFNVFLPVLLFSAIIFTYPHNSLQAQDTQFSQFYAAPLSLAPSFAGSSHGSRLVLNYRNQWPQMPGTFVAYSFSYDHYFPNFRSGVGIIFFRDQAGSGKLALTRGGLNYSYNFKINPYWTLRPGVQFLYEQRNIDFFRLIFEDQLAPDGSINPTGSAVNPIERIGYFDASSSLLAYSKNIWAGFSINNMMRPNQSMTSQTISRIPIRTSIFAGYRIQYGGSLHGQETESLSFAFYYKNQGRFNQIDIGSYWTKNPVFLGLIYRGVPVFNNLSNGFLNNDALIFMGGIRTNDLRIGYSYDFTISRLINNTGGAHEISLIYEFNQQSSTQNRQRPPSWGN